MAGTSVRLAWGLALAFVVAGCARPLPLESDAGGGDLALPPGSDLSQGDVDLATPASPDLARPRTGVKPTGTWTMVASPADSLSGGAKNSSQPALSLYQGMPALAWIELNQVRVATFDGSAWTVRGNALGAGTPAAAVPQLDGHTGQLHVGYLQLPTTGASSYSMYVYRWSGTSFDAVGAPVSQGPTYLPDLALAVDSAGKPFIAWTSLMGGSSGYHEIVTQHFDGTSWSAYGTALHAEGATSNALSAHLAIDGADHLYSAWEETFVHVYEGTGGTFAPVGSSSGKVASSTSATSSYEPRLTVDGQGRPVVGWMEYDGTAANIYVARFSGTAWGSLAATPISANGGSTNAAIGAITTDGVDAPIVAWTEPDAGGVTRLYVARIAGNAWTALGQPVALPTTFQYLGPPVVVVDVNDVPMVVFSAQQKSDSTYRLFVYRYL